MLPSLTVESYTYIAYALCIFWETDSSEYHEEVNMISGKAFMRLPCFLRPYLIRICTSDYLVSILYQMYLGKSTLSYIVGFDWIINNILMSTPLPKGRNAFNDQLHGIVRRMQRSSFVQAAAVGTIWHCERYEKQKALSSGHYSQRRLSCWLRRQSLAVQPPARHNMARIAVLLCLFPAVLGELQSRYNTRQTCDCWMLVWFAGLFHYAGQEIFFLEIISKLGNLLRMIIIRWLSMRVTPYELSTASFISDWSKWSLLYDIKSSSYRLIGWIYSKFIIFQRINNWYFMFMDLCESIICQVIFSFIPKSQKSPVVFQCKLISWWICVIQTSYKTFLVWVYSSYFIFN